MTGPTQIWRISWALVNLPLRCNRLRAATPWIERLLASLTLSGAVCRSSLRRRRSAGFSEGDRTVTAVGNVGTVTILTKQGAEHCATPRYLAYGKAKAETEKASTGRSARRRAFARRRWRPTSHECTTKSAPSGQRQRSNDDSSARSRALRVPH